MINKTKFVMFSVLLFLAALSFSPLYSQLRDDDVERYLNLAKKYYSQDNYQLARHYAEFVTSMSPGNLEAQEIISNVVSKEDANQDTGDILRESTQMHGSLPVADADEAILLANWQQGEPDSDARNKAGADLSEKYLEKAQALDKRKGDPVEILLYLRKALVLNSENGWVQYELFKALSGAGRIEESLPYGRKFLKLVGFGVVATDVKRKLVAMLMATGDKYSARSCWHKASGFYREVGECEPSKEEQEEAFQKLVIALKTLFFKLHGKEMYVECVPYLDQLADIRPEADPERADFDKKHYWTIKKFAPDVYWLAALKLKERGEFKEASNCVDRILASGPAPALRKKATDMKEALVIDMVAANADNTIGFIQQEEANDMDAAISGADSIDPSVLGETVPTSGRRVN